MKINEKIRILVTCMELVLSDFSEEKQERFTCERNIRKEDTAGRIQLKRFIVKIRNTHDQQQ